jgi:lipid-A-disaccharide synthase
MSSGGSPRIYVSTGEPSGDLHGAAVVRMLRRRLPAAVIEATGGPHLASAGALIRHSISGLGAMGAVEILKTIPRHLALLSDLTRRFTSASLDLLILVDYPGFHLRLARAASAAGVPVLYYIAPQLWAWGASRATSLKRNTRHVAVILPFEEPFLRRLDIPATFVGHPLLDQRLSDRTAARGRIGLSASGPVLGIFPGSRPEETGRMWPVLRDAARLVRQAIPEIELVVAGPAGLSYQDSEDFLIHRDAPADVLAAADAGLCKSGTITLQAALNNLPMVIAYRMHSWSHAIARRAVRVPHIGLVNLVAGREVAPEFIQDSATATGLAKAVVPLLDRQGVPAGAQRTAFHDVRARLGSPGASGRVADIAARLVA